MSIYKPLNCSFSIFNNFFTSIWSKLPVIGSGGGHDDQMFVDAWNCQLVEAVNALEYCVEFVVDEDYGSFSILQFLNSISR